MALLLQLSCSHQHSHLTHSRRMTHRFGFFVQICKYSVNEQCSRRQVQSTLQKCNKKKKTVGRCFCFQTDKSNFKYFSPANPVWRCFTLSAIKEMHTHTHRPDTYRQQTIQKVKSKMRSSSLQFSVSVWLFLSVAHLALSFHFQLFNRQNFLEHLIVVAVVVECFEHNCGIVLFHSYNACTYFSLGFIFCVISSLYRRAIFFILLHFPLA